MQDPRLVSTFKWVTFFVLLGSCCSIELVPCQMAYNECRWQCIDTNLTASEGSLCAEYSRDKAYVEFAKDPRCGLQDNDTFVASTQCCGCGGGRLVAVVPDDDDHTYTQLDFSKLWNAHWDNGSEATYRTITVALIVVLQIWVLFCLRLLSLNGCKEIDQNPKLTEAKKKKLKS